MLIDLKGKNILVTGGAGDGLGQGICEAIEHAGGRIIINDLEVDVARQAAGRYSGAFAVGADISKPEEVKQMFKIIKKECGTIHGLVNNAGIGLGKYALDADVQEVNRLYDIDVKGIWINSKAFAKQLLDAGQTGNIVNISSIQAFATMHRMALYAGAKSAVNGLTRGLAVELGQYNIRCNAVAPGLVYSEQTMSIVSKWTADPEQWIEKHQSDHQCLNFLTTARDCGNVVVFLLSELSRSITGQTIHVDNGTSCMIYNNEYVS